MPPSWTPGPVREGEPIPLPTGARGERIRRKLRRATERAPFDVFIERRGRMCAGQVVGVIDVGEAQFVIHPKTTGGRAPAEFLSDLLWASGISPRFFPLAGSVSTLPDAVPDALARAYAEDLLTRLRRSVPRRYHEREELSPVLRGRIDFTGLATAPPGREHLLPIRYAPLHTDNDLSRLLRASVGEMHRLARSPTTRGRLAECDALLRSARKVPLSRGLARRVVVSRLEAQWEPAVQLAQLMAKGRTPSPTSGGSVDSLALVFSLNDLFEAVIRRSLPVALMSSGLQLEKPRKRPRLLRDPGSGREFLTLKADYLLADPSRKAVAVADAKWKVLTSPTPGYGLSSSDVYQVGTYMTRHGVDRGILFHPRADWMPSRWRKRAELLGHGNAELRIVAVDIAGLVSRHGATRAHALNVLGKMTVAAAAAQPV